MSVGTQKLFKKQFMEKRSVNTAINNIFFLGEYQPIQIPQSTDWHRKLDKIHNQLNLVLL